MKPPPVVAALLRVTAGAAGYDAGGTRRSRVQQAAEPDPRTGSFAQTQSLRGDRLIYCATPL
jgi:hypothetical protein